MFMTAAGADETRQTSHVSRIVRTEKSKNQMRLDWRDGQRNNRAASARSLQPTRVFLVIRVRVLS